MAPRPLPATLAPLVLAAALGCQQEATTAGARRAAPATNSYLEHRSEIDRAVERGLDWLAAHQEDSGGWTGHVGHKQGDHYFILNNALSVAAQHRTGHAHLGISSLAGMAFLAGGHLPRRGKRGEHVARTLDYVLSCVQDDGLIRDSGTRMYSHAFAALFLAQMHGMDRRHRTKEALEKAVHLIVDCQNPYGAWRYNPFSREADLSVTVCQLQALRAARNVGIMVPLQTIERATHYVKQSREARGYDPGLFYYKIHGRGAYRKLHHYSINAAGITALYAAGVYDANLTAPALRWLDREYRQLSDFDFTHYYYWYGNYYAAQAFFQAGGTQFATWYDRVWRDLVRGQQADGRWLNYTGPGDAFSTAVACIILQIPRQYLPIFQR